MSEHSANKCQRISQDSNVPLVSFSAFFLGCTEMFQFSFVRLIFFHDGMSTVDAFFTSAAGCKCLQRMSAESSSHVPMGVIKLGWRGNPRYIYIYIYIYIYTYIHVL